jgi:DNA-binding winged helix-turn-helix (wHTH) protein
LAVTSKILSINDSNKNNYQFRCVEHCFKCKRYASGEVRLSQRIFFARGFLNKDSTKVKLSYPVSRLLCLLHKNQNKYVSTQEIFKYVWGDELRVANNVNVSITELRVALSNTGFYILNKRKVGYILTKVDV